MSKVPRIDEVVLAGALLAVGAASCRRAEAPPPAPREPIREDYPPPAPLTLDEVRTISVDYRFTGFHNNHLAYRLDRGEGGRFRTSSGREVDERAVAALVAAVTDLHPSDGIKECTRITDWYPQFRVVLTGAREVTLETRSNCAGYAPWSVVVGGDLFIQYDGKLGPAIGYLLARIDPAHFGASAPPDVPEAFTVVGNGEFSLSSWTSVPDGVRRAAPPHDRIYAGYLEQSPLFRAFFPGQKVASIALTCELSHNPDCERVIGEASAAWGSGFELSFPMAFDGATVTRVGLDDGVEPLLRRLIATRVLRKFIQMSTPPVTIHVALQERCAPGLNTSVGLAGAYFAEICDAIGAPPSARCDIYHVSSSGIEPMPSLYYYPSIERVWVGGDPYVGAFIDRLGVTAGHARYDYHNTYVLRLDGTLTVLPR